MKSKTTLFEKRRFRRDYFFKLVVTAFGLLVLAIFATLLLHILTNALPLLQSPKSEKIHNTLSSFASNSIGLTQLQGEWVNLSVKDCALYLSASVSLAHDGSASINPANRAIKKFAPNCTKHIIALAGDQNQRVVVLTSDNVLEIYYLENKDSFFLTSSIALPDEFSQTNSNTWNISISGEELFIQRPVRTQSRVNNILTLRHSFSSLAAPTIRLYEGAVHLLPIAAFEQVLVATQNELRMYDSQLNIIQTLVLDEAGNFTDISNSVVNSKINSKVNSAITDKAKANVNARSTHNAPNINALSISPSSLDIFVRAVEPTVGQSNDNKQASNNDKNTNSRVSLNKFTLVNNSGDFLLRKTFALTMPIEMGLGTLHTAFDLQHNAGFFVDEHGHFILMNIVTGDIKLQKTLKGPINRINYAQGQLQLSLDDRFELYQISQLQGMTSMQILFGKNDYAGYASKEYLWQTSVSNASQSPKYSVIPLIMGSVKASVLALIVALPLALGAAIYTAYFAPPHIRNAIKPSIEMLEAIPSVIIGFIAAVWLAPFAERYLISIFSVLILLPFVVLIIAAIHGFLHSRIAHKKLANWQLPLNASLLLLGVVFIFALSLLITDYSHSEGYDSLVLVASNLTLSKTAIVVSLALGVAIAPTIYTLIDDALFEVPEGVKQASFALGATKVQTLVRVVLVVAFPSIVSAIMLGFGRAFGETMIILMVTGNTPIANWDLLSGLRTLTSNLAIELQEAPVDSTVYHILFLTAAILFAFTFVVNTIAALLKRRMHNNDQ
jgi:phosphate transport system permease protein